MIWASIRNILAALIRNAFQRGHHCTSLERDPYPGWGWTWLCSCGTWGVCHDTELEAIRDFSWHTKGKARVRR